MSGVERSEDVGVVVVLGAREEVSEDVLLPRAVPGADGDVVLQREGINASEKPGKALAASRLLVEHVHVRLVVHEEQHAGVT